MKTYKGYDIYRKNTYYIQGGKKIPTIQYYFKDWMGTQEFQTIADAEKDIDIRLENDARKVTTVHSSDGSVKKMSNEDLINKLGILQEQKAKKSFDKKVKVGLIILVVVISIVVGTYFIIKKK